MAAPNTTLSTLRPDLGTLIEFDLERSWLGFIGYQLFPVKSVAKQSGTFGLIKLNEILQKRKTERAPGSGYPRSSYEFGNETFSTRENGHEEPVDVREKHMYADYFDQMTVAEMRCVDAILRNAEERIATLAFDIGGSIGVNTTAVKDAWNDYASATGDPLEDIRTAKMEVRSRCGRTPNTIAMEWETWLWVREHPVLMDRVKHQGYMDARATQLTRQAVAQVFDVDQILVAGDGAMINDANQDAASPSLSSIYPRDKVLVCVTAETDDIKEVCYGRTLHWEEDGSEIAGHVETYWEDQTRSEIVRVRHDTVERHMYVEAGELLTSVMD